MMKENQDLESNQDKEMEEMLSYYIIDQPNKRQVDQTIENLKIFVPDKKRSRFTSTLLTLKELIQINTKNFFYIESTFYLYNLLFFIGGLIYCLFLQGDPYVTVMALSPVPFILGLIEVFKGRDNSLFELELSCKYSASQLMATKITITSMYNLLLSGLFVLLLDYFGTNWLLESLMTYWLVPISVVSVVGLYIATKFRSMMVVPPILAVWLILIFLLAKVPVIQQGFESISFPFAAVIILFSWFLIIYQVMKFKRGVTVDSFY
jgi:hypothetical protein